MKIYITHNGQTKDDSLTELGKSQAERLGAYLKHIEFAGKIYCMPQVQVHDTAKIIESFTGSPIILHSAEDIRNEFKNFSLAGDTLFVVDEKNHKELADILGLNTTRKACNCSLSVKDFEGRQRPLYADVSHLPYKSCGYDFEMKSEIDAKIMHARMEEDIPLFEEISKEKGTKLLHISDTSSFVYPYVGKMIDVINPDIIIHTGDFVDEVKAGRMINTCDEYECGVKSISKILNDSGAKIYAVCGNNDILEILNKYLPNAEVSMPGNVVNICGTDCLLVHGVTEVTDEAEWVFYGHGLTGETWSPDKNNIKSGRCRFNAIWNLSAIILPERKHYIIKHPEFR